MADIAVIDSDERKIDIETFRQHLGDLSVDRIKLHQGSINTQIDRSFDLSKYHGLYVRVGKITEAVLDRAENLEIISTCGSGYDHVDVEAATERGVFVTHTPEAPAPGAVEHTFGLMFTLLCRLPEMFDRTANGGWGEGQTVVNELHNRTIGIVGLGTIGSKVAELALKGFNANVIAYDPYVMGKKASKIYPRTSRDEIESMGVTLVQKEEVFRSASVVTMHVPLTPDTRSMVKAKELKALEGGYFMNLSRGGVVDEKALVDAVKSGILEGVALDVMCSEPPDSSNPLLGMSNVYVTPHIAGGKEGYKKRSARINSERIKCTLEGGVPSKIVNPEVLEETKAR
jgi:D-3-phosphoglycerate dehydrogenase